METKELQYQEQIQGEADFWDERAAVLLSSGRISSWFDYRRGEDVTSIPLDQLKGAGLRANPVLYRAVFGDMIGFVLKEALKKKGFALDLGCGAGWFALELARGGMNVDGFDISPRLIAIAKTISQESEESSDPELHGDFGSTNFRVVDLNRVSLEENKYEAVVSWGTLHHIQRLDHLLREIKKSLKPGGTFIFYEFIGYHGLAKAFPVVLKAAELVPRWLGRLKKTRVKVKGPLISPFEGVSREHILELGRREFFVERVQYKFLFLPALVSRLRIYRLNRTFSLPLVKFFNWLDQGLIKSRIFRGPFVLVLARKNE
jgi:2-polyprenyl-3-methyl-5-hydroxy-6-metoxy-1,4-benzoquinol methylase